jgi:hypothetical protein
MLRPSIPSHNKFVILRCKKARALNKFVILSEGRSPQFQRCKNARALHNFIILSEGRSPQSKDLRFELWPYNPSSHLT